MVSDVQLDLDLRLYPIRGEAQHLFEKRLAPKWHLEHDSPDWAGRAE